MKNLYTKIFLLLAFFTISYYSYAQVPELMYFKFDLASGTSVDNMSPAATRVSTNGTLSGATVGGVGQFGAAMLGNGGLYPVNSMNTNWPLNLTGQWTISMWISGINNTLNNAYLYGTTAGTNFRAFTGSDLISGAGNILIRGTGLTDVKINNVFDAAGSPVVVHIVYDNTQIRTYVNGVPDVAVAQAAGVVLTGPDFILTGKDPIYGGFPNGAKLDEFRMYNRALTATEIANTWNVDLLPSTCIVPSGLNMTDIKSNQATLNWNTISNAVGYEYIVNQSATDPTVNGTYIAANTANITGLVHNTTYYAHVRTKCNSSYSGWATIKFVTRDLCRIPTPFTVSDITSDSAKLEWTSKPASLEYEYYIDTVITLPASGYTSTTATDVQLTELLDARWYYVHIRSKCDVNEYSDWYVDSFRTRKVCLSPELKTDYISTERAVIYWEPIASAVTYEYAVTQSSTPPVGGTKVPRTNVQTSALNDGEVYYFHARCNCNDEGYLSNSPWANVSFETFPTSISSNDNGFGIHAYPNPVQSDLIVKIDGRIGDNAHVTLIDVSGKIISSKPITGSTTNIDMNGLANGVYLIKYTDAEQSGIIRVNKN